jgi:Domain of unknown function (DUF4288)
MHWFLAKLVFRIVCGQGDHTPQFDEQLRLLYAEDELHAFHKARLLSEGDCGNDEMENTVAVKWKFIDVIELHHLTRFTDGAEIYSVIKEEADANLYIRGIQKKATQLLQRSLHQFTGLNSIAIDI